MTDAQLEKVFERVLTKLEEIRCGLIDIETLLERKNDNAKMLEEVRINAIKAIGEINAQIAADAMAGVVRR